MIRKIKNKIIMLVFTLITFLSFGIVNVNADTVININSKNDYVNNREINEVTTLKLTNNVSLEGLNFDNGARLEISANLVIDLNGHTLTVPDTDLSIGTDASIYLQYHGNHTVTIIDSSVGKTGMIVRIGDRSAISIYDYSSTVTNVTLNIEGIKYKNSGTDNYPEIYDFFDNEDQTVNVNIKDSTFEVGYSLYYGHSAIDTVYPSTLNLDIKSSTIIPNTANRNIYIMSNNPTLTYDDIMVTGDSPYGYEAYGDGVLIPNTQVVSSTGYKKIEIKKVQRFEIEVPTFADQSEDYAPIAAQNITIRAIGSSKNIVSVELNSDAEFELTNVTTGIVAQNETNTTATIKPKDNLKYGLHTAIIKVKDTDDTTFTAEVTFNVNAYGATQVVMNETDLRKFLELESSDYPEVTTVKLGDDIILDSWLGIYVLDGKTLDLNGYTLTTSSNISIIYGTDNKRSIKNADFNLIDSGTTGEIINTNRIGISSLFMISEQYYENEDAFFTFNLNGGTYSSSAGMFDMSFYYEWADNANNRFEFNLQNAEFSMAAGDNIKLIYANDDVLTRDNLAIKLEDITVNLKGNRCGLIADYSALNYTVGDIIPNTHRIVYPKIVDEYSTDEEDIADREDLAEETVRLWNSKPEISNYQIKVERIDGFVVDDVTFADVQLGYGEVEPLAIKITALGSDRTVSNVYVSDETKFEKIGTGTPTIDGENYDNTTFKIKPKTGLGIGTHTATIKVYDDGNVLYTAKVTFNVGKANISPTVDVLDWEYGSEPNDPSINGNTGHADFTYAYEGINGTTYSGSTPPSDAGEYRLTVTIDATEQYNGGSCTTEFEITKKQVTVDESKVIFNNKVFDGNSAPPSYVVTDALNMSENMYTHVGTITNDGGRSHEQAGTYKATVTFTIHSDFTKNYEFVGGGSTYITADKSYSITPITPTLNVQNTTIAKGNTLDLKTLVGVEYVTILTGSDPYNLINYLSFAEPSPAKTGVSISGSNLSVTNAATSETIQITVTSPARKLWESSGDNEFNQVVRTIDITIVDKPTQTFNKESTPINLIYGNDFSNPYTSNDGGTVTYSSSDSTVVEVNSEGRLFAKKYSATGVTITVTAAETSTHAQTSISYTVNVGKRLITPVGTNYLVSKIYDGTTTPGIPSGQFGFSGALTQDELDGTINVVLSGTLGNYESPNVSGMSSQEVNVALSGTAASNYELTTNKVYVNYTIYAKDITETIDVEVTGTCTYTGSKCEPTVVVKDGTTPLASADYDVQYVNNINAGTNTAKVVVNSATLNYTWTEVEETFSIGKATYTGTLPTLTREVLENNATTYYLNYSDITFTPSLSNPQYVAGSCDNTLVTNAVADNTNSRIAYTVASKPADTNGSFKVTVGSANYQDIIVTVNVTTVSKTTVTIGGNFASRDFNNQAIAPSEAITTSHGYNVSDLEVLYTSTSGYNSNVAPKDAGVYTVTYSVPASDPNYMGSRSWTFTISKINPTYNVPTDLNGIIGNKLSSVTLPDGFTWEDSTTDLIAGNHAYEATYTPDDATNYNVINNISINVYTKNKYTVTTSVLGGNGNITSTLNNILEGTTKEITFTADTGYMIDTVLINDIDKTNEVSFNKITLTVDNNITVKVSYKKIPFTLTINEVTGATINPSGVIDIFYGDDKTITITANHGYNLISIKVNNNEKLSELSSDGELTLTNITEDTNVVVVVEKIVYEVLEGKNLKTKDTSKLRFRFDVDYSKFTDDGKVYIDGDLIDESNYTSEEGSTIITLTEEFANSLSKDEHAIKVVFNDGGEAITNFTIIDPTANPQTGDNILTFIILLIISTFGIVTSTIVVLKKRKQKLQ